MVVNLSLFYWLEQFRIDPGLGLAIALLSLVISFGAGILAGYLKLHKGLKTNYSRKVFHFIVFSAATLIAWFWGLPGTIIFGISSGIFLITSLLQGDGSMLYEGIAREQDRPQRSLYLIAPFVGTAIGGMLGNLFFGASAIVGYLVVGWGDAVGEPFGVMFGRHKYRVFTLTGINCQRSLEGSMAVFIASTLAASLLLMNPLHGAIIGLVATLVEAQSPHGLDNLTVQIAATAAASMLALWLPV